MKISAIGNGSAPVARIARTLRGPRCITIAAQGVTLDA